LSTNQYSLPYRHINVNTNVRNTNYDRSIGQPQLGNVKFFKLLGQGGNSDYDVHVKLNPGLSRHKQHSTRNEIVSQVHLT
jgi:hypothetical protein